MSSGSIRRLTTLTLSMGLLGGGLLGVWSSAIGAGKHAWRLAFVVCLGALLALPLARVTEAPTPSLSH